MGTYKTKIEHGECSTIQSLKVLLRPKLQI